VPPREYHYFAVHGARLARRHTHQSESPRLAAPAHFFRTKSVANEFKRSRKSLLSMNLPQYALLCDKVENYVQERQETVSLMSSNELPRQCRLSSMKGIYESFGGVASMSSRKRRQFVGQDMLAVQKPPVASTVLPSNQFHNLGIVRHAESLMSVCDE